MPVEHPLNDLDADLRGLLSAEPPVEFAARVRQRIAGERMARPVWTLPAFGIGLAALVVAAAIVEPQRVPPPSAPEPPGLGRIGHGHALLSPVEPRVTLARSSREVRGVARPRLSTSPVAPAAEVMVDRRQRRAVHRLLDLARTGTILEFAPASDSATPPIVVDPLNVPLITVDPPVTHAGAERSAS